jgi:hypothetical protein
MSLTVILNALVKFQMKEPEVAPLQPKYPDKIGQAVVLSMA